ncbi:histidine kinase [Polaribacter litorisediminis]|uniref:sensor histidine kinase n=1 Tax=Polaribacter litorisediminis TaxID=1908341 RepID=UPI001CBBC90C|nr:histidine kinase [Polaribacter litorisediminis]UAM98301.1 histidine kinase [Polaribacter litorisediminis]
MNTKLDKSDYIILTVFYLISITLNIFDYLDQDATLLEYLVDIPMFVITSLSGVLLFMYFIIPRFLLKKKNYILFALYGLLVITSIGIIERVVGFSTGNNDWSKFPKLGNLILYAIFNGSDSIGLALGILITKKFYEGQTQISKIKEQQKENELKLLRSQINPHFLFNNLNTLDSLIDSNPEKAKEYINKLSLIYRYLIKTKDAEVMELSSEIELAKNYIFLIKTRFGKDYEFTIEENMALVDKFIPTGALQSLLENVVKHNKSNGTKPIKTTIQINEGWLMITNTKSKVIAQQESFGTGLKNLETRYQLLSDEKIQILNTDTKFEVFIPIMKLQGT